MEQPNDELIPMHMVVSNEPHTVNGICYAYAIFATEAEAKRYILAKGLRNTAHIQLF